MEVGDTHESLLLPENLRQLMAARVERKTFSSMVKPTGMMFKALEGALTELMEKHTKKRGYERRWVLVGKWKDLSSS